MEADEESVASFHSIKMNDDSDLNDYERDALNAAFENIDSFVDKREVGLNMTIAHGGFVDPFVKPYWLFQKSSSESRKWWRVYQIQME